MSDSSDLNIAQMPRLGLVQRLRVVFVLIVVIIGIAVTMALWQFKTLIDAQSNLLRTSVPILVRAQVIERALHDLVLTLGQIESAPDDDALEPISRNVSEQFARARQSVSGLEAVAIHAQQTEMILQQMSAMENGILSNLSIKKGLFQTEFKLESLLTDLAQQQDNIRIIVEQMSLDASHAMDVSLSDAFSRKTGNLDALSRRLNNDAQQVSLIAQLALELETIANFVGQLGISVPQETLNDTKDFLAFRMRGALQLLVRLPETPARTELAAQMTALRDVIFAHEGILYYVEDYVGRSRDLTMEHENDKVVVRDITTATEKLMASAHDQLTQSSLLTQVTTQRLILILAIAAIFVAIIVVTATLVIVERQINQRIGLLTNSVLRIAAGDTEHETRVSGHDELGRMAVALEIFKRNAREVLRSNAELEKFAYAAAHDLRSPLQAIHDLTMWTMEDDENHLSQDSAENLNLLQTRVARLSALLADLLRYARIGADISEPTAVDLDALVNETIAMVDPVGAFQVSHDWKGGEITTYLHPLQKILLNLMSNTLKHHESEQGHIHISSRLKGERLWIEYSDDGPGIPPEYHTKVFELFQTLKPKDEMEGSGLGLAITQKLIGHFDGSVHIRSDPKTSSGTTFIFDFPAKNAKEIAKAA